MDDVMLCDCPGLVFPSFVSNTADLIAAGVYPISQMRDHWPVISLICQRIPRDIINALYGITLPIPMDHELRERGLSSLPSPTADELLTTYCVARGMLASNSGVPDYQRASRIIIKDYANGKLLYCHPPPLITVNSEELSNFFQETVSTAIRYTTKLHEKLLKKQTRDCRDVANADHPGIKTTQEEYDPLATADAVANVGEELIDDDLLDLVSNANSNKPKREHKSKQKWGKKGRKLRDKDPYGCELNPDRIFSTVERKNGVVVRAGKHTRTGYTRQLAYGAGSRGIVSFGTVEH
jgi:hypothetical protein